MADNPFESMLPYQQTSAYKTRVLEVARLMMEHQRGITLPQVTKKMRQIMEINIKQLFEERRSPDLVGSKLLYLSTWRECLKLYNPDGVPNFPSAGELESEFTDQSVCLRAPSTEYKAYHDHQILEERQRAANQEWQVIKSKVVEHLLPPVATQLPGNNTPQPAANQHGPSTTLASPAVNKNKDSDDMKPNSNPFAARTSLPSPIAIKPPGTDAPQPKPSLSLWDSLRVAEPSEAFPLSTPELSRGRGGDRGRGGRFQPY